MPSKIKIVEGTTAVAVAPARFATPSRSDAEVRDEQLRYERKVDALDSTFTAQIGAAARAFRVPSHDNNTPALAAECEAHNAEADAMGRRAANARAALSDSLADAGETDDYSGVFTMIENARIDKAASLQHVVRLGSKAVDLAKRVADELAAAVPKLDAEAAKVLADVKAGLTKIGSGLEAQPAFVTNGSQAEHTFTVAARTNVRSREALVCAADAKGQHEVAVQKFYQVTRELPDAKARLHKYAAGMIGS